MSQRDGSNDGRPCGRAGVLQHDPEAEALEASPARVTMGNDNSGADIGI